MKKKIKLQVHAFIFGILIMFSIADLLVMMEHDKTMISMLQHCVCFTGVLTVHL